MICDEMMRFLEKLFPIYRTLMGDGVRKTLNYIKDEIGELEIKNIKSGEKVFDWTIPLEWDVKEAYIQDVKTGKKLVDFKNNSLHLVVYSDPIDQIISIKKLSSHLYSIPHQPNLIPYITNYYSKGWGFCLQDNLKSVLMKNSDRNVRVVIDSTFKPGALNYGEIIIKGESSKEILLSSYICHPSLANNELSGPTVLTFIAKYLLTIKAKYTYRLVFVPETIGSIAYIHQNLKKLKKNVIAGYILTCIGDNNDHSFLKSRQTNTLADRAAFLAYELLNIDPKIYDFIDRGSDERQYSSPKVNLPICSIMRTKYGEYSEYHTSADNLDYVSAEGLQGGYEVVKLTIDIIDKNKIFYPINFCEPHLQQYDLYPKISTHSTHDEVKNMMNILAYSDGKTDLIELSDKLKIPFFDVVHISSVLEKKKLLKEVV